MKQSAITSVLKTNFVISILVVVGAFYACKKDEIVSSPQVVFSQPFANKAFDYGDTIWVNATISHPDLQSINLNLVDANYRAVEENQNISFTGNAATIETFIEIRNKNIVSGKHYVRFRVTAGGEQFNFQQPVNVFELPRERLALYVASTPNGITSRTLTKFVDNSLAFGTTIPGDVSGLATNSLDGSIFMAPRFNGPLLEFSAINDSVIFEQQNTASGGSPFMTGIRNSRSDVYSFYGNGEISQYGFAGQLVRVMQLPGNFRADDALFVSNTLIVHAVDGAQSKLFFYPASGTSLIRQIDVPQNQEHIRLEPYGTGEFLMLYNNNGQAGWNHYASNGQEVNIPALPSFKLFDAVSVSASSVVLGTDQGIKRFINTQSSLVDLSPEFALHLEWDEANERIVYTTGSHLKSCTLPAFQQVEFYLIPPNPQDIVLLYNK